MDTVNLTPYEKLAVENTMANYEGYIGSATVIDVLFLTSVKETGDEETYRDCQPQIVPIFGTFYVENEPEESGEDFGVSFTKEKYGGLLVVDPDEFAFDLFKIEGTDEIWHGRYFTEFGGTVSVKNLDPGKYVFREVFGYADPYFFIDELNEELFGTWGFIWASHNYIDGLFFELNALGRVIWDVPEDDLDEAGNPKVDNWLICKHNIMWSAEYNYHGGAVPNPDGDGWIVYHEGMNDFCGGWLVAYYIPATCEKPAMIAFGCSEGCGVGTGVEEDPALGHDVDYINPVVVYYVDGQPAPGTIVYGCTRCDYSETVNDMDLWLELTGWSDPYEGY